MTSKRTITKIWLGGIVAIAVGLVIAAVGGGLMLANSGRFEGALGGSNFHFVPTIGGFFWSMVAVASVGGLIALGGAVAVVVSWIGALVNSYQLEDKLWFVITLLLGVLGFGLIAMIIYVIAAPDSYEEKKPLRPGAALSGSAPQPS